MTYTNCEARLKDKVYIKNRLLLETVFAIAFVVRHSVLALGHILVSLLPMARAT